MLRVGRSRVVRMVGLGRNLESRREVYYDYIKNINHD